MVTGRMDMNTRAISRGRWVRRVSAPAACVAVLCAATAVQARGFSLRAYAYLDAERASSIRVVTEVSYTNLVFFKESEGYRAGFKIYVAVEDRAKKKVVKTAVLRGDVVARSYKETTLRENKSKISRTLVLEPGEYKIEATLAVKNTHITSQRAVTVVVPDFLASGIGFSSPVVFTVPADRVVAVVSWKDFQTGEKVADVGDPLDNTLTVFDKQPAVRFEIYLEENPREPVACDIFYEVLGVAKKRTIYGKRKLALTGVDDEFVLSFNVDEWQPGPYAVNLRVVTEDGKREATTSVQFTVGVTRAMLGYLFDETLEVLSLIASGEELEGLRNAAEEDRPAEWSKFWNERDPDPSTARNEALEEHLARVSVATERFASGEPGWRTDRGRIYIQYGAPERVERVSDVQYRGEYEIWRYYSLNRVFVFYDMFGLGDFRLVEGDLF